MFADFADDARYKVVINHEEQYSLWPATLTTPKGWREVGRQGTKRDCLIYIEEVWTDMRPLSLHRTMAEEARRLLRR